MSTREDFGEHVFAKGLDELLDGLGASNPYTIVPGTINQKRLAVVNLIHGSELILKAIISKNGYHLHLIKRGVEYPLKKDKTLDDILDKEKTIEYSMLITFFEKNYSDLGLTSDSNEIRSMRKLNRIRNQIQHEGTIIDRKERHYFEEFVQGHIKLYEKEFPKRTKFITQLKDSLQKLKQN
jgi:hypothetical protein